mmetsp:Transcript_63405/g.105652  ORF Transcript_63405/g.105652 Transcript_63405/m.105652 type:complete len:213 (+) Transcript_63405:436-1074(+)
MHHAPCGMHISLRYKDALHCQVKPNEFLLSGAFFRGQSHSSVGMVCLQPLITRRPLCRQSVRALRSRTPRSCPNRRGMCANRRDNCWRRAGVLIEQKKCVTLRSAFFANTFPTKKCWRATSTTNCVAIVTQGQGVGGSAFPGICPQWCWWSAHPCTIGHGGLRLFSTRANPFFWWEGKGAGGCLRMSNSISEASLEPAGTKVGHHLGRVIGD